MTQLLLFDTPAANSFAPMTPTPAAEPNSLASNMDDSARSRSRPEANLYGSHERGLNHMGDLARLVLLQYDLVAQRRAKRLAREAAAKA